MPIFVRADKYGYYFQYGTTGEKYYYDEKKPKSVEYARYLAQQQAKAIHVSQAEKKKKEKK